MRGSWLWLRPGAMPEVEECLPHLDGVIVPLHHGERGPLLVRKSLREWLEAWRGEYGGVWAMDWLPRPGQTAHLAGLVEAARAIGAEGVMSDCEPDVGWRGRVREAVAYRTALDREVTLRGLDLAITDYARGGIGDATLGALLAEVGGHRPIGVPQSYDPSGTYAADYHRRSVDYWRSLGAQRVVLGVGLWLRGQRRHRTPDELRRHLATVPEDVEAIAGWYADDAALDDGDADHADDLLPVMGAWRAGGAQEPSEAATRPTDPAPADDPRARWRTAVEALAGEAKAAGDQGAVAELLRCAGRL